MNAIDRPDLSNDRHASYARYTAPGMESDGVIHGPSHVHPGAH